MDYKTLSERFVQQYPDYKSDINNFGEYLNTYWKNSLSDESFYILLKGIDVEFILKSLIYNVEEIKRYKTKTKAKRYSVVMGQFFNFIRKTTDIVNIDLYDAISNNRMQKYSYMQQMINYIEKCDVLAGIVEQEPLTSNQAEKILEWANEQFESNNWEDITNFRKAMAAIGMKMMMLYGITYRELRKIKWSDYDEKHSCITINDFELRLPLKLSDQIREMKKFVYKKEVVNKQELLFTDYSGEPWTDITSSSKIPDYLGCVLEISNVTSIVKYGILQLIKNGLHSDEIKKLTGAKDKIIDGCILNDDKEVRQLINSAIISSELYYKF